MKSNHLLTGAFFCLVSVLSWGAMFPVMEGALKTMDPFYFTAIRYGTVAVIFLILLGITEGVRTFDLEGRGLHLWFFGSLGFAGFGFLVFLGQQLISGPSGAIVAPTIMATMPMMAALIGWVTTGKKPGKFTFAMIFLALMGVLVVITKGDLGTLRSMGGNLMADLFILAGAFCWVVYTYGGSRFKEWSALRYTALSCALSIVTIAVVILGATFAGVLDVPTTGMVYETRWQLAYMVGIAGVLAVLAWNAGNRTIGPINGVLFVNLVPVTALVITMLEGEIVTVAQETGAAIVIASLVSNNLYQRFR
ncbi:MAG: DMT family transporter [Leptospirales bacterium]